jgi:hypothetical protein
MTVGIRHADQRSPAPRSSIQLWCTADPRVDHQAIPKRPRAEHEDERGALIFQTEKNVCTHPRAVHRDAEDNFARSRALIGAHEIGVAATPPRFARMVEVQAPIRVYLCPFVVPTSFPRFYDHQPQRHP